MDIEANAYCLQNLTKIGQVFKTTKSGKMYFGRAKTKQI